MLSNNLQASVLERVLDFYYRILRALLGTLLAVMIVPICVQMASRYVLWIPKFIWTEEIARFCFVWIVMIGSMIAVRDGTHFEVDLFSPPVSKRHMGISRLIVHLAMTALAMVFLIYGVEFAEFGWGQASEMSGLNLVLVYSSFPIAGLTWLMFLSEKISDDVGLILGSEATATHQAEDRLDRDGTQEGIQVGQPGNGRADASPLDSASDTRDDSSQYELRGREDTS